MALGPDLARLQAFQHELLAAPLEPVYSFVSLTEVSEYTSTEADERARLEREEGLAGDGSRRAPRGVARADGALPREPPPSAVAGEAAARLLPDVEAPRRRRELVRAPVRRAQGAHGRARTRRPHLRRPRPPADHRLDRARRLGVGRHAARRRPGRARRRSSTRCASIRCPRATPSSVRSSPARAPGRRRLLTRRLRGEVGHDAIRIHAAAVRLVPRGARRPADDLRDRQASSTSCRTSGAPTSRNSRVGSSSSSPGRATPATRAIAYLASLGCTVNPMEGDVVAG